MAIYVRSNPLQNRRHYTQKHNACRVARGRTANDAIAVTRSRPQLRKDIRTMMNYGLRVKQETLDRVKKDLPYDDELIDEVTMDMERAR